MKHLLTIIAILLAFACCTTEADRTRMRAGLDSINQRNRAGQPFTVRQVEPYVRFFDSHGTPNDRLLAHYLLGRAYHEHGEAPMALQCYHDAIDCADTTAADCNFAQLARVYGQMAEVFYYQGLYRQQLLFEKLSVEYAWKGNDTLLALQNYEQECYAYNNLALQDSAILIVEDVASMYEQYGYSPDAAIALAGIVRPLINRREYQKAKNYMDIYETKSGLFDTDGNIEKGREIYYNVKGLYYLYNNKLDSAEYFFRKELHDGKDYNNQNAGANRLVLLYQRLHNTDSIAKYSLYAYAMSDSLYANMATEEIEHMAALYDYTRNQEIARQKSKEVETEKKKRQTIIVILLLVVIISSILLYMMFHRERHGLEKYRQSLEELRKIRVEKAALCKHESEYSHIIEEKEKRIDHLEKIIKRYGKHLYFSTANAERCLKESPAYSKIESKAVRGEQLSSEDWKTVSMVITEYFPGFDDFLTTHSALLSSNKRQICLLLRLHFKPGDISKMLDTSSANISQESSKILKNIFKKKGSSKDLSLELCKIF
jgi:hypothetical protein